MSGERKNMGDPYFLFFPGDYIRDTLDLTLIEHGAYFLMLLNVYSTGSLPVDRDRLYRLTRTMKEEEKTAVDLIAERFFYESGGKLFNRKADKVKKERANFISTRVKGGLASAASRRAKYGTAIPTNAPNAAEQDRTGGRTGSSGFSCRTDAEPPSPSPIPLPLQIKDKTKDKIKDIRASAEADAPDPFLPEEMTTAWNEEEAKHQGNGCRIPKILRLTPARRKKCYQRTASLKLNSKKWKEVVSKVFDNDFLSGKNPSKDHPGWRATFDWVIKNDDIILKIIEGAYDQ